MSPNSDEVAGSVTLLAPGDFASAITGSDVFVVNVHIPYEGEIEGTDALIPFDKVEEHAAELPADKSAPLYIYCRSGRMSAEATPDLQRLGYTNIIDLDGGMHAWEQAGLPLVHRAGARRAGP
jgi:rhodanese-related sulfurtransferase